MERGDGVHGVGYMGRGYMERGTWGGEQRQWESCPTANTLAPPWTWGQVPAPSVPTPTPRRACRSCAGSWRRSWSLSTRSVNKERTNPACETNTAKPMVTGNNNIRTFHKLSPHPGEILYTNRQPSSTWLGTDRWAEWSVCKYRV